MPLRIAAVALALLIAGCIGPVRRGCGFGAVPTCSLPVVPSFGGLFAKYKAPLQTQMHGGTRLGRKTGTAMVRSVRDPIFTQQALITWGETPQDAAIHTAAMNGGITTIRHVDYELLSVLSIYSELTVIVYGD